MHKVVRTVFRTFSTSPIMPEQPLIFAPETYQYKKGHLNVQDLANNPIEQFQRWFSDARAQRQKTDLTIPEATTFSTASLPSGRISLRVVLFKELDQDGFIVYSNWDKSKKAENFKTNKYASLTFFWPYLERQVRVEGIMEKVDRVTLERYFKTRPRGSKIGAWSSPQLQIIQDRSELDELYKQNEEKFKDLADDEIPCPELWGGMRIVPLSVEFWQGGNSRLHDRLIFEREEVGQKWNVVRRAP